MGIAKIWVSWDLIRDLLHMPPNTILREVDSDRLYDHKVQFIVEHPDIHNEKNPPILLNPVVRRIPEHFEFDWNNDDDK